MCYEYTQEESLLRNFKSDFLLSFNPPGNRLINNDRNLFNDGVCGIKVKGSVFRNAYVSVQYPGWPE